MWDEKAKEKIAKAVEKNTGAKVVGWANNFPVTEPRLPLHVIRQAQAGFSTEGWAGGVRPPTSPKKAEPSAEKPKPKRKPRSDKGKRRRVRKKKE